VAKLLGDRTAILLQGHGAATVGGDMEDSVTNMLHLEEQARMNYLAYCAAGPDHPRIPDDQIDEMTNRPGVFELPHFAESAAQRRQGGENGVWAYYSWKVSRDL
jgi:ribulose-5-phosphate 4-epimerase/fuculose-1-phosphate aldolase